MTNPDVPVRYKVSYSGLVRDELKSLVIRARSVGRGHEVLAALRDIDSRLRIYPQFGQPLRDLEIPPLQLWVGVIAPLVVRYILDDERRLVMVAFPFGALPRLGF